jgi:hypothetical protein
MISIAAAALAVQLSMTPGSAVSPVSPQPVQYRVPVHPPPCGHGWDVSARDGLCYPNGYLPPQDQAARQYQHNYRGGHYPVPCGHGTDVDSRDGRCYRPDRSRRSISRDDNDIMAKGTTNAHRRSAGITIRTKPSDRGEADRERATEKPARAFDP